MEALIIIAISLATSILKKFIVPKFGEIGVHITIFLIALIGTGVYTYGSANPSFMEVIQSALAFLIATVGVYEILLKKINFFKKGIE
jgi:heme A synthase